MAKLAQAARTALAVLLVTLVPLVPALAQDTPSTRFSGNMTDLKSSLRGFAETIDAYNHAIKDVTDFDTEAARIKVAEIKDQIHHLLDQLSDNGALAKSQYELSRWIERNRRLVRSDALLSPERKALLEAAWAQRAGDIDKAGKEIVAVRKELVEHLNKVVGDETYLTQLLFLEKAGEAAALIRQFLHDIKSFSDSLRQRMEALPVPGPVS